MDRYAAGLRNRPAFIRLLRMSCRQTHELRADRTLLTLIAHHGDTTAAPENSLKSIVAAGKSNMDYAEIDVRLTSDGKPVLFSRSQDGKAFP